MSTFLELPSEPTAVQVKSPRSLFSLVDRLTGVVAPVEQEDVAHNRASGPAFLLTLVLAVCTCIFTVKCLIALHLRSGGPLSVYDPGLPRWQSIPLWLLKSWLCCTEDFAVGTGILLVGTVALWLLSRRSLTIRRPWIERFVRGSFWLAFYAASFAAMALMIVNLFVYLSPVSRYLDQKRIVMAGTSFEKSVRDEVTLKRQLLVTVLPLGIIMLQLRLVGVRPRFWNRLSYWICRPVVLTAGLAFFFGLSVLSRIALGDDTGGFQHNPHVVLLSSYLPNSLNIDSVPVDDGADFLPGHPAFGGLKLQKKPTNVIVVIMESTGSHWMHDYGAPWPTTPNLEQIVEKDKNGILLSDAYSISDHTIASALSLFSSMNNHDTENCAVYAARDFPGPNRDFPVPAASTWMRKHGYRTYFVGAGGESVWEKYKNLARAFLPYGFDIAKDGTRHWGYEKPDWPFKGDKHDDVSMFEDAYRCIDDATARKQKFFLMMWNYDTHWTYTDGDGPEGGFDESKFPPKVLKDPDRLAQLHRYLKAIWRMDRLIGKLYHDLEKRGLAEDTLLVVTGDHGQSFGQHGIWTHGYKLYEEEVRVPLFFINKHLGEYAVEHGGGPRCNCVCSHIDVWPTIMEICGLPCHPKWQGKSIFNTEIPPAKRHAYLWVGGLAAIREGDYKYIWDKEDDELYLFNLKNDPAEQDNLVKKEPTRANELRRRLHMWLGWQAVWNERLLHQGKRD